MRARRVWAVVATHNRQEMLDALLGDIDPLYTVVIDHRSLPPIRADGVAELIRDRGRLNLSRLWNRGLDAVARLAGREAYDVAILNDDLRLDPSTLPALSAALDQAGGSVAYADPTGQLAPGVMRLRYRPAPDVSARMTGYCFLIRGEAGLRFDARLRWWYGDDDLERQAERTGGILVVGGLRAEHLAPNGQMTPRLRLQAARDRAAYAQKWGGAPW